MVFNFFNFFLFTLLVGTCQRWGTWTLVSEVDRVQFLGCQTVKILSDRCLFFLFSFFGCQPGDYFEAANLSCFSLCAFSRYQNGGNWIFDEPDRVDYKL